MSIINIGKRGSKKRKRAIELQEKRNSKCPKPGEILLWKKRNGLA